MVEHTAVNRGVVGSSPTRGVIFLLICEFSPNNIKKIDEKYTNLVDNYAKIS